VSGIRAKSGGFPLSCAQPTGKSFTGNRCSDEKRLCSPLFVKFVSSILSDVEKFPEIGDRILFHTGTPAKWGNIVMKLILRNGCVELTLFAKTAI